MITYHAVMGDETGGEFGVDVEASSRDSARDMLRKDYPESQIVQLESPRDRERREWNIYAMECWRES